MSYFLHSSYPVDIHSALRVSSCKLAHGGIEKCSKIKIYQIEKWSFCWIDFKSLAQIRKEKLGEYIDLHLSMKLSIIRGGLKKYHFYNLTIFLYSTTFKFNHAPWKLNTRNDE